MKSKIGITSLCLAILAMLINHYFITCKWQMAAFSFSSVVLFITGVILVIPFEFIPEIIYDNREDTENKTRPQFVLKLRYRAMLFNNISILIFFFTLLVILIGFYLLVYPPLNPKTDVSTNLTVRISASVLLVFLVQILFKVFKYLLRVAAFYNAKADAIEFKEIKPDLDFEKLMDLFTPDKYDITDLQQSSVTDNFVEMLKARLSK